MLIQFIVIQIYCSNATSRIHRNLYLMTKVFHRVAFFTSYEGFVTSIFYTFICDVFIAFSCDCEIMFLQGGVMFKSILGYDFMFLHLIRRAIYLWHHVTHLWRQVSILWHQITHLWHNVTILWRNITHLWRHLFQELSTRYRWPRSATTNPLLQHFSEYHSAPQHGSSGDNSNFSGTCSKKANSF